MAKHPHRIMLALTDETYEVLNALAAIDGKPVATIIRGFLEQLTPTLVQTMEMIAKAKAGLGTEALLAGMSTVSGLHGQLSVLGGEMADTATQWENKKTKQGKNQ